jgi:3-methyladenine DNA glycosylase AlkC
MSYSLKDLYFSREFTERLADAVQEIYPSFNRGRFIDRVHDDAWEGRELKERMRHLSRCLHAALPEDYPQALGILRQVVSSFDGLQAMVFPDYVECYGLEHWELSLPALAYFTAFGSSEFAVRPFLARDPERAMVYVRAWAEDENEHVRRLASEGCRPQLPWAMDLPAFKEDPSPILPVLETLKDDPSEYVRKSVANNLNGISKGHPDLVLDICERWIGGAGESGASKERDWIVKHACRTMLKAGNRRALILFGFGDPTHLHVENLALDRERLPIGASLQVAFDLRVEGKEPCKVRLELAVDYRKARGNLSRKIFQMGEATYDPGLHRISRGHSFQDRSTRKHHPGEHRLSIVVNGVEKAKTAFQLETVSR